MMVVCRQDCPEGLQWLPRLPGGTRAEFHVFDIDVDVFLDTEHSAGDTGACARVWCALASLPPAPPPSPPGVPPPSAAGRRRGFHAAPGAAGAAGTRCVFLLRLRRERFACGR